MMSNVLNILFNNFYIMKLFHILKKTYTTGVRNFFTDSQVQFYKDNGYVILPKVFSKDYIEELKAEVADLVSKADEKELGTRFYTGVQKTNSEDYFMESGDKIRFFLEHGAYDKDGHLVHPLKDSINKIGHCLHDLNKKFINFSYSKEMQHIAKRLGYIKPIIPQSMYIFKNAKVGGEVPPHTDNAFIRTKHSSCFVRTLNIRVFGLLLMTLLVTMVVCGVCQVAIRYLLKDFLKLILMRMASEGLILTPLSQLNMILLDLYHLMLRKEL
jgi:hypothetical protein